MKRAGLALVGLMTIAAAGASAIAPHGPNEQFLRLLNAPPTVPHFCSDDGGCGAPFIYKWRLVNQLEQIYEQDRSARIPLVWLSRGKLVTTDDAAMPLMLLGTDSFGRDVLARLLYGARTSLGVAALAAIGALALGLSIGGVAGYAGGALDDVLMRISDFVMVLPAIYVALALRSILPLILPAAAVFALLAGIFALVGTPFVARGVRGIVRTERRLDYASAAEALGAGHARLLVRHLLPAARGFVAVEITMLIPAFIVAEATLSYIGLGFPDPTASWGTMLHEAANVRVFVDSPWLLSPAIAMFAVVFGLNLALQGQRTGVESIR